MPMPPVLFVHEDLQRVLYNRFLIIIGDSVQRAIYKDFVLLLQENRKLTEKELKTKGEVTFCNDLLIERSELTNGKQYSEVRQFQNDYYLIRFYFVTRCYSDYIETILADLQRPDEPEPDIVIMNSCLWDVTRYGPRSMNQYKVNLQKLFIRLKETLPAECLFIWNTAMPIACNVRGGFMLPELSFRCETLRLDVMEGNFYARQVAVDYEFDVLDLHYTFRDQQEHRTKDGVHWDSLVHRRITNFLLVHICQSLKLGMPSSGRRQYIASNRRQLHQSSMQAQSQVEPSRRIQSQSRNSRPHQRADTCPVNLNHVYTPLSITTPTNNRYHNEPWYYPFMGQNMGYTSVGASATLVWEPWQQQNTSGPARHSNSHRYGPYGHF